MSDSVDFLERKITPRQRRRISEALAGEGNPGGWVVMFDTDHPEFTDGLYFAAIINEGCTLPEFSREDDAIIITAHHPDQPPIKIAVNPEVMAKSTWVHIGQLSPEFYAWVNGDGDG